MGGYDAHQDVAGESVRRNGSHADIEAENAEFEDTKDDRDENNKGIRELARSYQYSAVADRKRQSTLT